MAHQSENSDRLPIFKYEVLSIAKIPSANTNTAEVWLFTLPFARTIANSESNTSWFKALHQFAKTLNEQSIIAILTTAQDAAETLLHLSDLLKLQLWISVKLSKPIASLSQQLPEHHASLLVLSKYRTSLRHAKTRIQYTYCPACDKTTKDYGGKKHTYHQYGTLMSDVWRDIEITPNEEPINIITRLADLFGIAPYDTLNVVNLMGAKLIQPKRLEMQVSTAFNKTSQRRLESQLINGDSLVELKKIPDDSVEFCFADPPYNLAKKYDSWDDAIDIQEYLLWCDNWLDELARVLKPGCTCAVLNIPILAARHLQHMKQSLSFQSWIVWEGLSLPVRMIMPAHYATVCFAKGKPRPLPGLVQNSSSLLEAYALTTLRENYCVRQSCVSMRHRTGIADRIPVTDLWWDIHRLKHNSRRVDHPCQLPPAYMRRLISLFTEENEVVLDPFNGAGTTTLCAAELSRRFIGIELSEKYHSIAENRHQLLLSGINPFEKTKKVPKSKNSRVARMGSKKYNVPKKTLQLDVKRVAKQIGKLPSREELSQYSKYPIHYFDEYFKSWAEVCAAARTTGMSETRYSQNTSLEESPPTLFDL